MCPGSPFRAGDAGLSWQYAEACVSVGGLGGFALSGAAALADIS